MIKARRYIDVSSYFVLAGIIVLVIFAYAPGLHGPFVLDDGENIVQNRGIAITDLEPRTLRNAATANNSGVLGRPLASLSFALNHYLADGFTNTFAFKATNLAIHITNSILVYALLSCLLRTPALAPSFSPKKRQLTSAIGTAVWALHPIQLTSVLYVVQRMTSLSALFVLLGLIVFIHGRIRLEQSLRSGMVQMGAGIYLGLLLGLGAKENAALLPVYALIVEWTLFDNTKLNSQSRRFVRYFHGANVGIPLLLLVFFIAFRPEFITDGYLQRHFTLVERLLTEPRVLWFYLGLLAVPTPQRLNLFHDDWMLSTTLLQPWSTMVACAAWLTAFTLAIALVKRYPLFTFSILWFVAGHSLESSVIGLELAYEHRNYLPSLGILFGLTAGIVQLRNVSESAYRGIVVASTALAFVLTFSTWVHANTWSNVVILSTTQATNKPNSPRANDFAARVSLSVNNDLPSAIAYTLAGINSAPHEVGFRLDLQQLLLKFSAELGTSKQLNKLSPHAGTRELPIERINQPLTLSVTPGGLLLSHPMSEPAIIGELFEKHPISVHAVTSIELLSRCITSPPRTCAPARSDAIKWLTIAVANTRTSTTYRGILYSNLAMLYADRGEYDLAYAYMTEAAQRLPDYLSYELGRIEYLIGAGRFSEATQLLNRAKRSSENDLHHAMNTDAVTALYKRLELAKQKAAVQSSTKVHR